MTTQKHLSADLARLERSLLRRADRLTERAEQLHPDSVARHIALTIATEYRDLAEELHEL